MVEEFFNERCAMSKSTASQTSKGDHAATLLRLLDQEGLSYDALQLVINDPAKRKLLVQYWNAGIPWIRAVHNAQTCTHDARRVNDLLSLGYTEEQLTAFGPPPACLHGFLTFFDPGWDIRRLHSHCEQEKKEGVFFYKWYDGQNFATRQEEPGYRQIRTEAVEESFNKTFASQKALLPDTEEIPSARQVAMGMVVHFLVTGFRLFPEYYVRCIDKDDHGRRLRLGSFDSRMGLGINHWWDDVGCPRLGLISTVLNS